MSGSRMPRRFRRVRDDRPKRRCTQEIGDRQLWSRTHMSCGRASLVDLVPARLIIVLTSTPVISTPIPGPKTRISTNDFLASDSSVSSTHELAADSIPTRGLRHRNNPRPADAFSRWSGPAASFRAIPGRANAGAVRSRFAAPDAPLPALFATTRQAYRVRRTAAPARGQKERSMVLPLLLVAEGGRTRLP